MELSIAIPVVGLLFVALVIADLYAARRRVAEFFRGSQYRLVRLNRKYTRTDSVFPDKTFAQYVFFADLEEQNGKRRAAWIYAAGLIVWFGRDPVEVFYVP